jgi:hypothetical protein
MKCKGCDAELLTDAMEILGKMVKREYCDPCMEKAKAAYQKLSTNLKVKVNPPKK